MVPPVVIRPTEMAHSELPEVRKPADAMDCTMAVWARPSPETAYGALAVSASPQ